jgi:O-antigen ligase
MSGLVAIVLLFVTYMLSDPIRAERLSNPATGSARAGVAYASLKLIAEEPILGSGFETFDQRIPKYLPNYMLGIRTPEATSHVTLLTLLAELGVAGTSWLVAFMFAAAWPPRSWVQSFDAERRLLITVNFAFILAFVVNAFLIDMRFFSLAYCWLFISFGIIDHARRADASL